MKNPVLTEEIHILTCLVSKLLDVCWCGWSMIQIFIFLKIQTLYYIIQYSTEIILKPKTFEKSIFLTMTSSEIKKNVLAIITGFIWGWMEAKFTYYGHIK